MKKWKEFEELLNKTRKTKNPELTYLHGIVYGLDYPGPYFEIQSVNQDITTYHAIVFNTEKRASIPLKDLLTKPTSELENIDLVRFQSPDPEQAEYFLRLYSDIE